MPQAIDLPANARPAPALSASGPEADSPKPATQAPAPEAAAEPPKPGAEAAAEPQKPAGEPKPRTPIQDRLSEISARRREAEARAEAAMTARQQAEERAARAEEALAEAKTKPADQQAPPQQDPRPNRTQFNDPDSYEEALIEWSTRRAAAQAAVAIPAETARRDAEAAAVEHQRHVAASFAERASEFQAEHDDYQETVSNEALQISTPMSAAILQADNGPAIAYYLGKNPKEAATISQMAPAKQLVEIGRLSAKVEAQSVRQASKAPDPIVPVGGRSAATAPEMTPQQRMDAQLQGLRKRKTA